MWAYKALRFIRNDEDPRCLKTLEYTYTNRASPPVTTWNDRVSARSLTQMRRQTVDDVA